MVDYTTNYTGTDLRVPFALGTLTALINDFDYDLDTLGPDFVRSVLLTIHDTLANGIDR